MINDSDQLKSDARFAVLADTMPQMVWSTLPDGFHDYYNARWYEFTGMPPGSTDGEAWNGMFHPDDQERAWALWRRSLETGEPYEVEYRLRHHSGEYRWTLGRALPLRDENGAIVRWYGTCTDIDAAKRLEDERTLVANELSHRIKNIFAVISGLIHLSARSFPEAKGFADSLRDRVGALGRAHDFVSPHSRRSGADTRLFAMLAELLAPYQDGTRIVIEGEDAAVDDRSATPLGLVFHELATNAAKYGALSTPDGRVTLTSLRDGDSQILTWTETDGPAVTTPLRTGFGSNLTRLSIEGQLDGQLDYDWRPEGLVLTLTLPRGALSR